MGNQSSSVRTKWELLQSKHPWHAVEESLWKPVTSNIVSVCIVYILQEKNMTRRTIETKLRSFLLQISVKFMILWFCFKIQQEMLILFDSAYELCTEQEYP